MVKRLLDASNSASPSKRAMRELGNSESWVEAPDTVWKETSDEWIAPRDDALREALRDNGHKISWRWRKANGQMGATIVKLIWKVEKKPLRDFEYNIAITPILHYAKAHGGWYEETESEDIRRFWGIIPAFPEYMHFDTRRLGELFCDKPAPYWLSQAIHRLADEYAFAFYAERMASKFRKVSSSVMVNV